ncbi:universal stress protein [Thalassospira profundimaris]|uniref:Universal stress protein UspA n=1 Tax=Thalassospira profundimaris TaxID=502049 RepID=A0A367WVR1_9PROT|nr:universal stress protein [Thalassospira profundimaris]RCK44591.1 universal stress protein UspA [Thalassospira profundimaris]
MAIRTILAPVAGTAIDERVMETAFRMAKRFDAHLEALFVAAEPQDAIPIVGEGMSGLIIEEMIRAAENETEKREISGKASFEAAVKASGVEATDVPSSDAKPTCAWRKDSGREDETVARRGRLFDLVVIGRDPKEASASLTFDAALMETGRPILVAPEKSPATVGEKVMIAWNGGVEAARAVTSAMPLLRSAKEVTIVSVGDVPYGRACGKALAEQFRWHGVEAVVVDNTETSNVANALISEAEKCGADTIVLGAYSHSRFKEMILGGVTQDMLGKCTLPLWIMH